MDENVVFPPKQDQSDPNAQPAPEQAPAADASADPNAAPDASAETPADGTEPVAADGEEVSVDTPVPPPPPPSKAGLIKKILIGIGVLFLLIFLITLFIPKGDSSKEVNLIWWGLWEDERAIQVVIEDFQRANPNITVKYVKQDPKQYRSRLETRIQNGTGPDIFRFHNSWVPMISKSLLPLSSDVITPADFQKQYYPVMQSDLVQKGAIYGIPVHADTLTMFANTELFDKAGLQVPATWEEFVETSRKLTVKDPETDKIQTAGAALGTYNNITHASDLVSMLFVQQGIEMNKFSSPENVKRQETALDFYTAFAKGEQRVWDSTLDESVLAFARGNLGLYFGYSWDIFRIKRVNNNLKFKTFPVPGLQGGDNATIASYWVEGVNAKSKNKTAAFLFMKYLAQKETAQKLYENQAKLREFGELYPRKDLADSLKDNELVYPFIQQLPFASSTYFAAGTFDGEGGLNSALNAYLANTVTAIVTDEQATETSVKTFNGGVVQVYTKYGIQ